MSKFEDFRSEYGSFVFKDYSIEKEEGVYKVYLYYSVPRLREFKTRWEFPAGSRDISEDDPILKELVFNLGMVEAISYYKCVCPKVVEVECGNLNPDQIKWWRKLFYNGLGEFMYRNGIDVTEEELLSIRCIDGATGIERDPDVKKVLIHDTASYSGCLVPVGGGKDSVVSLEILKDEDITTYSINGNETTRNVIDICKNKKADYRAKRILDKGILEMNELGFLNGHIPFSAVVAWSTVITAYLTGIKYIALSNENSANESTVRDSFVNHQYSKSYEFEQDFDDYLKAVTDSDIHYFSLLRPLTEIQIAALFSKHKAYHKAFRSCNAGSKQGIWCCNCPKCLFVYIILSPFLSQEELTDIFGERLLDKDSLDRDFRELMGIDENKPFECVGTRREVQTCMKHFRKQGGKSLLTDRYARVIDSTGENLSDLLDEWNDENHVPDAFAKVVSSSIKEL
ncbi:MAG: hypothetical protein IKN47_05615 [Lachnospiraceae bacterium]|nr:hypothetical protein [Lachnospiraceae bacterium]